MIFCIILLSSSLWLKGSSSTLSFWTEVHLFQPNFASSSFCNWLHSHMYYVSSRLKNYKGNVIFILIWKKWLIFIIPTLEPVIAESIGIASASKELKQPSSEPNTVLSRTWLSLKTWLFPSYKERSFSFSSLRALCNLNKGVCVYVCIYVYVCARAWGRGPGGWSSGKWAPVLVQHNASDSCKTTAKHEWVLWACMNSILGKGMISFTSKYVTEMKNWTTVMYDLVPVRFIKSPSF